MSLKWPAHKASERIARNNAVKIAAAFVAGIDAKKVVEDFMSIHPQVTDNAVQDRVRARAWAIVHVRYNSKPMEAAIRRTYADGWVTGDKAAKQLVDSLIKKADDWSSWTPGSEALAQMVAPKGALAGLLENAGVVSNQLWATKLDEVGTILANGLRDGSTVDTIATNLEEVAGGESKAMVIARTELNRAMTQAAVSRYQDSGIDQVEWEAADPDDECADNDGEVVTYGEEFPSGDIEPPVHPNCRCGLLPVIAEAQTDDGGEDLTDDATPDDATTEDTVDETPEVAPVVEQPATEQPATWTLATSADQVIQQIADTRPASLPPMNDVQIKAVQDLANLNNIYLLGKHAVYFEKSLKEFSEDEIQNVLSSFKESFDKLPEWRRVDAKGEERGYTVYVNREAASVPRADAYTYIGSNKIWVNPSHVRMAAKGNYDYGNWHMPSSSNVNPMLNTIAHEMGHTADTFGNSLRGTFSASVKRKFGNLLSRYGNKNPKEAYAEIFSEWMNGDRESPIVKAYADRYGWNLSAEEYRQAEGAGIFDEWKA